MRGQNVIHVQLEGRTERLGYRCWGSNDCGVEMNGRMEMSAQWGRNR